MLACALLVAAACGGASEERDGEPTGEVATATPRAFSPRFSYHPCTFGLPEGQTDGDTAYCGSLEVLERRDGTSDRTITLEVAVLKAAASDANKAPDPVIYLAGGPGSRALEDDMSWWDVEFAEPLQDTRDLVFFDQRGAGLSRPALSCGEYDVTYYAHAYRDETDQERGALRECRDRLALTADLSAYNSASNAADIVDLATALGYDQYNLYGVSYGTRLALTAMRDAPARIRSVVLDSTVPLQANLWANNGALFEDQLEAFFDACSADASCRSYAPDLRGTFLGVVAQLEASPAAVEIVDAGTGRWYREAIDGAYFMDIMFDAFYYRDLIPELPRGIMQVSRGDYRMLSDLASYSSRNAGDNVGMYLSVECSDEMPFDGAVAATPNRSPGFWVLGADSVEFLESFRQDCAVWNVAPGAPIENAPVVSAIPTLVLAGQFDPITPPSYGRMAAETLAGSTFVEFAGYGHAVLDEGCPSDITVAFFDNPTAPPDTSCAGSIPPLEFASR